MQATAEAEKSRLEAEIQLGMTAAKTTGQLEEESLAAIRKALEAADKNRR